MIQLILFLALKYASRNRRRPALLLRSSEERFIKERKCLQNNALLNFTRPLVFLSRLKRLSLGQFSAPLKNDLAIWPRLFWRLYHTGSATLQFDFYARFSFQQIALYFQCGAFFIGFIYPSWFTKFSFRSVRNHIGWAFSIYFFIQKHRRGVCPKEKLGLTVLPDYWVKYNWWAVNTKKNGIVTATKLGTTNKIFVAANRNFAAATKRFVDKTKHFVVVTKYFCYPYFNKWFCWCNKIFFSVKLARNTLNCPSRVRLKVKVGQIGLISIRLSFIGFVHLKLSFPRLKKSCDNRNAPLDWPKYMKSSRTHSKPCGATFEPYTVLKKPSRNLIYSTQSLPACPIHQ